jgi:hypothetical protein
VGTNLPKIQLWDKLLIGISTDQKLYYTVLNNCISNGWKPIKTPQNQSILTCSLFANVLVILTSSYQIYIGFLTQTIDSFSNLFQSIEWTNISSSLFGSNITDLLISNGILVVMTTTSVYYLDYVTNKMNLNTITTYNYPKLNTCLPFDSVCKDIVNTNQNSYYNFSIPRKGGI